VTISENFILGSIGYLVYSCGISLTDCEEILISNNTITKCILHGISLLNSDKNTLVGNNVQYNNASGMYLLYSNNNLISNNDIAFNNIKGIFVEDSQRNIISKNNINDNGEQYVFFSDAFFNTWNQNYWGSGSRFKYIVGLVHFEIFNLMVPIVKVDWHQATHPYNFGGG
jgi:parallel beta-helix repeat protein